MNWPGFQQLASTLPLARPALLVHSGRALTPQNTRANLILSRAVAARNAVAARHPYICPLV